MTVFKTALLASSLHESVSVLATYYPRSTSSVGCLRLILLEDLRDLAKMVLKAVEVNDGCWYREALEKNWRDAVSAGTAAEVKR